MLATVALAVSACGGSSSSAGASGDDTAAPAASEEAGDAEVGTFPRTVKHTMGETEIPAEPQRIVAVNGNVALDSLLALGIKPVGAGEEGNSDAGEGGFAPYVTEEQAEGIAILHSRPEVQVEEVLALKPDLILAQDSTIQELYPQLSQIAPTVAYTNSAPEWRETFELLAESVGREAAAEDVLAEIDAKIEDGAEAVAGYDGEISIFYAFDGFYGMMSQATHPGIVLEALGLKQVDSQLEGTPEADQIEFTEEQIDLIDGDAIYALQFGDSNEPFMPTFEAKPTFKSLEGVKAGGYERLPSEISYHWYYPGVLTVPRMVDDLVERHGQS
jgi:iron complex transport system substrate-binding protein